MVLSDKDSERLHFQELISQPVILNLFQEPSGQVTLCTALYLAGEMPKRVRHDWVFFNLTPPPTRHPELVSGTLRTNDPKCTALYRAGEMPKRVRHDRVFWRTNFSPIRHPELVSRTLRTSDPKCTAFYLTGQQ